MMKKLFVLTIVMEIISFATADFVFNIDGYLYPSGSTVPVSCQTTVGFYNDTQFYGNLDIAWIEVTAGAEVPDSGTINNDVLPGTWTISDYGAYSGYYYWYIVNDVPEPTDTLVGDLFTVDVHGPTTLTIYEIDLATIAGTVTVDMEVICPFLSVSSNMLSFTAFEDGVNPGDQTLTISNSGVGTLAWSMDTTGKPDWLTLTPTSGALNQGQSEPVTLSVDITGLSGGQYNYAFDVVDPNADSSPQTVTVDLEVIGPILDVSSNAFSFTAFEDGVNPGDQTLTISNPGGGILNWSMDTTGKPDWLTLTPTSGALNQGQSEPVTLSVDITGLSGGQYNYAFDVADPNATDSPMTVTVDLEVIGPIIDASPYSFTFYSYVEGVSPPDQLLSISNSGGGTLNWQITENCDWLTASPLTGSSTGETTEITLSVDVSSLVFYQTYQCNVLVSDSNAENNPVTVPVTLEYIGGDCVNELASCYDDWVEFGMPDCWCYQYQCRGDANGLFQTPSKSGYVAIYTYDLTILAIYWQIKEPPYEPGVDATGICADFDHAAQGTAKTGYMRVYTNDLAILSTYWNIKEPPRGPGIPDCPLYPEGDLNYYTEP